MKSLQNFIRPLLEKFLKMFQRFCWIQLRILSTDQCFIDQLFERSNENIAQSQSFKIHCLWNPLAITEKVNIYIRYMRGGIWPAEGRICSMAGVQIIDHSRTCNHRRNRGCSQVDPNKYPDEGLRREIHAIICSFGLGLQYFFIW